MGILASLFCSSCIRVRSSQSEDSTEEEEENENINNEDTTAVRNFKLNDLIVATNNFREQVGVGGFGKVYKGMLRTGQIVAVKCLDRNSSQGTKEFHMEILMLAILRHPNLVSLVGYYSDDDRKILVYEYLSQGSLYDHLFDLTLEKERLDWHTRLRIALGIAKGLECLHLSDPPIIHRDLKSANILLDENLNPKLADFGLARVGPVGDNTHVSTRVMGTEGYCAPEYFMTGRLTLKSDIYSFGTVLLELITGRKASQGNLVNMARPLLRNYREFARHIDPTLNRGTCVHLDKYVNIVARCVDEDVRRRPLITHIAATLDYLVRSSHPGYCNPSPSSRTSIY